MSAQAAKDQKIRKSERQGATCFSGNAKQANSPWKRMRLAITRVCNINERKELEQI